MNRDGVPKFRSAQELYDWARGEESSPDQQQRLSGREFAEYVRQGIAELESYLAQR